MTISDKARKLAQSFLTLDDLVLGQSLVEGGLSQVGRVGFSASGPSVALNVASRFVCLGAQVATRAVGIPLPGDAGALAGKMSNQAKALGERCSNLAVQGIDIAGGRRPRNPITKEEWLNKRATPGYTPGELAADTVFGTLQDLTTMPITVGMDTLYMSSKSRRTDRVLKAVDATIDNVRGGSKLVDRMGLRRGLAALALESGIPFAQTGAAFADAAARLAFSDTRALRAELSKGLARARLLAENSQPAIGSRLRDSAKKLVHHPPTAFMAALERGPNGNAPSPFAILRAMIKDWRALSIFSTMYPQMMSLVGTDLMTVLGGGPLGKRVSKADNGSDHDGTPTTFTVIDSLVGSAITENDETPLFSRATVYLAQDLSFLVHRDQHGREAALERSGRLFGELVRERIASDISLNADLMVTDDLPHAATIRKYIGYIRDGNALSRQIDHCANRLTLLESMGVSAKLTMADSLTARIHALRLFTSLASCDLALRGCPPSGADSQAKNDFLAWASEQG